MDEPGSITAPRVRRFGLLDAMVLTGATAVPLRFSQKVMAAYDPGFSDPLSVIRNAREHGVFSAPVYILFWFEIAAPFLLAWALALAVLRWMPPRPPRAEIARRAGSVAVTSMAAAVAFLAIGWVVLGLPLIAIGRFVALGATQPPQYNLIFRTILFATIGAGLAVAASWTSLLVGGTRAEGKDWIDRVGTVLGGLALLFVPFHLWAALILI